jgi:hypothetical protein
MSFKKRMCVQIGVISGYLASIIFLPILKVQQQPIIGKKNDEKKSPECRQNVKFIVGGDEISSWLYLPEIKDEKVPCIVMSHGFGGTKDMILENYAMRFVEAGYAALTYDYRHYGESDGEPRQMQSVPSQLEDLRAAIRFARLREEIDPEKIILWGTSAAGGYGVTIAAEDRRIKSVIAQCSSFDHKEDSKLFIKRYGIGYFIRLLPHAQRDKGRARVGLSPHTIPTYGKPGTLAVFATYGAYDEVSDLVGDSKNFINETCARVILMPYGQNLLRIAKHVKCPVLILVCERDEIVSPNSHKKVESILGDLAEVKMYPIGHFDIYKEENFEKAIEDQIEFLVKHELD